MTTAPNPALAQAAAYLQAGRLAEAAHLYQQALADGQNDLAALEGAATVTARLGRHDEAVLLRRRLAALEPGNTQARLALADALDARGDFTEAEKLYREASGALPRDPALHIRLGKTLEAQNRAEDAVAAFRAALALDARNAEGWHCIGDVRARQDRHDESGQAYRQALVLNPAHRLARAHLGIVQLREGAIADGMETLAPLATTAVFDVQAPAHKARHDKEQLAWRAGLTAPADGARVASGAVNPANAVAATAQWRQSQPKLTVIDNLLTPAALDNLRRYCLAAPVWQMPYENGYLGATPESGFAAPVLAQIAEELAAIFPAIIGGHPLRYYWGFKYDSRLTGINVHGDDAAINVNFWITPDGANCNPQRGGLVVWDVAAPRNWDFDKYNGDKKPISDFLKQQNARPITIPYRANRAVIFDSDLFHETDAIDFQEGYENRRLNITMLFGKRFG